MQVHIIDDVSAVRKAVLLLLDSAGYEAVEHDSARTFLDADVDLTDACLIVDVRMAEVSGIDLLKRLHKNKTVPPTILLSGFADVPLTVEAMRLGVLDVIEKPFNDERLLASIKKAETHVEGRRQALRRYRRWIDAFDRLTDRERQVMELIVEGCASKDIAARLSISPRTVEVHRRHVMTKLEMTSVAEVARVYIKLRRVIASEYDL